MVRLRLLERFASLIKVVLIDIKTENKQTCMVSSQWPVYNFFSPTGYKIKMTDLNPPYCTGTRSTPCSRDWRWSGTYVLEHTLLKTYQVLTVVEKEWIESINQSIEESINHHWMNESINQDRRYKRKPMCHFQPRRRLDVATAPWKYYDQMNLSSCNMH